MVGLDAHHQCSLVDGQRVRRFLVFGPEPAGDGFLNIGEGFLLVFALRDAAGQRGAFDDNPAVFDRFHCYVEDRRCPLKFSLSCVSIIPKRELARWCLDFRFYG